MPLGQTQNSRKVYPLTDDGLPVANYAMMGPSSNRTRFGGVRGQGMPAIIIIGAGYTGVSAALHLAEYRQACGETFRIVLMDANSVGSGPSGKSAGHVCGLQADDADVLRHCGQILGNRLIESAAEAATLVRSIVAHHSIPCDLLDGYLEITERGEQRLTRHGDKFAIDPYPFVLGMAKAAEKLGVEIIENVRVTGIDENRDFCHVTADGTIHDASFVLAAGGHRMALDIPLLTNLRNMTTELKVTTIITDPVPDAVLRSVMPSAHGQRFPFSTLDADVAYGTIDRSNRIIFGVGATAMRNRSSETFKTYQSQTRHRLTEVWDRGGVAYPRVSSGPCLP